MEKPGESSIVGASSQKRLTDLEFWEKRSPSFAEHAGKTRYPNEFLSLMRLEPDYTVLDMGCGGGALAIPLSARVKKVTAVDFSPNMLAIIADICRERNITNIETIHGEWDSDWAALGIGKYDIAIASRSLRAENCAPYIRKLANTARRQAFISAPEGNGPQDTKLLEFTGRETAPKSDYRQLMDVLRGMGINADLSFIEENHTNRWQSFDEAVEAQKWMFFGATPQEEEKMRLYLERNLIEKDGMVQLPYERTCRWAVMWWDV
jgi:SAM-dependent methyltransferase